MSKRDSFFKGFVRGWALGVVLGSALGLGFAWGNPGVLNDAFVAILFAGVVLGGYIYLQSR